jgi:hypothetical protein
MPEGDGTVAGIRFFYPDVFSGYRLFRNGSSNPYLLNPSITSNPFGDDPKIICQDNIYNL